MNKKKWFVLSIIPVIVLLVMLSIPLSIISNGKEITLITKPISFSYQNNPVVYLELDIEEVQVKKLEKSIKEQFIKMESNSAPFKPLKIYSVLKQNEKGFYKVERVMKKKPNEGVFIVGTLYPSFVLSDEEFVFINYELNKKYTPKSNNELGKEVAVKAKTKDGRVIIVDAKVN